MEESTNAGMTSANISDKIRSRGYYNFKVVKNLPLICVLNDKTLIAVETIAQKIIKTGDGQGRIFAINSVIAYTSNEVRKGTPLSQEQDLEFEIIQEGELVCKIENEAVVTLNPVIVQINRAGVRLTDGEEQYDVVTVAKAKIGDGSQ